MRINYRKYFLSTLLLSTLTFLSNCDYSSNNTKRFVSKNLGRKIELSGNVKLYLQDSIISHYDIPNNMFSVVSFIHESLCDECVNKYLLSADYFVDGFNSDGVQFIAVIPVSNPNNIIDHLNLNLKHVKVVYDYNNKFFDDFSNSLRGRWNVYLIDGNQRIMAIGDPLTEKKICSLYKKIIIKELKENFHEPEQ